MAVIRDMMPAFELFQPASIGDAAARIFGYLRGLHATYYLDLGIRMGLFTALASRPRSPEALARDLRRRRNFGLDGQVSLQPGTNAKMAEFMNANIPGVSVPKEMIDELRAAGPERAEDVGVDIAVRTIKAVRSHCDGVHVMAIKATHRLAEIITKAEVG